MKTAKLNSNVRSDFLPEVEIRSKLRTHSENSQNRRKAALDGYNFHAIQEIDVAECISGHNLRPEVELMHLLCMHRHYRHKGAENSVASEMTASL